MPYGGVDYARIANITGNDEVVANSRMRATLYPQTIGTVTFPVNPLGTNWIAGTGTPISTVPGASSTIDIGQMLTGIVVQAPSAGNTSTLDTAANIVAGINKMSAGAQVGDIIQFCMANGSGTNTVTVAAGSGGTFDTNISTAAKTIAVNSNVKWILVRLTNVTSGSEAYVIYM
jgi:hypothetical protein